MPPRSSSQTGPEGGIEVGFLEGHDSMVDAGIREGDLLVVDFSRQPQHGDIVIARLDDGFTVKRLYKRRNAIRLCPENKAAAYEAIEPQEGQTLEVLGVVRFAVHSF
jgi:DNA polymerase V